MFWAHKLTNQIQERFANEIGSKKPLVIRDEKTMSGRVHVGSLRGVVIHGAIADVLAEKGIAHTYLFEINDFDLMDGLPVYVDQDFYRPYMGRLLCDVPAPDNTAKNYAEYWAADFDTAVKKTGSMPTYYRSSELYRGGKYNDAIKRALDSAATIRKIYKEVSGSVKSDTWLPIQIVCENCSKVGTTEAIAWDGERVTYQCKKNLVKWAEGCGHQGSASPYDGKAKLPWKVEWPAKFMVMGVHVEGGGKDHYTKGGSRDVARRILTEVFHYQEPFDVPYNFFVLGGAKMSSSKGRGASATEIAELLPQSVLRFLLLKEPLKEIDFNPEGNTVPILYDNFDLAARVHFGLEKKDDVLDLAQAYPYSFLVRERANLQPHFMPRFSLIAFLVQMPHLELEKKVQEMKGAPLTEDDKKELRDRSAYAQRWLQSYSPEEFKFELQETLPTTAHNFTSLQKKAVQKILDFIQASPLIDGHQLHAHIHEIKNELAISPNDLFSAVYISFLGKNHGPQAGWFLASLDRNFVIKRLEEVIKN